MIPTDLKSEFRMQMLKKRAALSSEEIKVKSDRIAERLLSSPLFSHAPIIHFYLATPTEVQTDTLIEKALLLGKRIVAPVIFGKTLRFFEIHDLSPERFRTGPFGIREPLSDVEIAKDDVHLWVLPGVAYDTTGRRLGQGGGYYDHLFASGEHTVFRMALAFELQICPEIPFDRTDCCVDQMITEERVILCEKGTNNAP